jgi:hypothetical protein
VGTRTGILFILLRALNEAEELELGAIGMGAIIYLVDKYGL